MAKLNVLTAKITNIFTLLINSSFDDFKKQLAVHSKKYNNFPMRPLNWKSSSDYLNAFLPDGQVFDLIYLTSLTNQRYMAL